MAVRFILGILAVSLVFAGCKNEPYEVGALSIATLANKESGGTTLSFGYRAGKLRTFSSKSTAANHDMIFYYAGEALQFITSDSTGTSFSRTNIYFDNDNIIDSTFLYPRDSIFINGDSVSVVIDTTLVSVRTITYDADENPTQVKTKTWTDGNETNVQSNITWENGNVTRIFTTTKTGETTVLKDEIASYDDKKPVYSKRREYIYTLSAKDIFWLSAHNPVMFNDGSGQRPYSFTYNRLGYPSGYTSNVGTKYGLTYNQIQ